MKRRPFPFLIIILVTLGIIIRWNAGPRTIDDAYITYRYARNLLSGIGFVYNPGEHVLGTTTPLYTMLLALIALPLEGAKAAFPQISLILNSLIDGLNCLFLFRLGNELRSKWVGYATALAWAIAPFSVTFAIGGLETSLFVLLLLLTSYYYVKSAFRRSAFFAALAFLTRPDALILLIPLSIDFVIKSSPIKSHFQNKKVYLSDHPESVSRKIYCQSLTIFTLPILLWVGFATVYFGTPIPQSMIAKALAYHLPANSALIRLLQHYATPFFEDASLHSVGIFIGLFIYPSLSLLGTYYIARTKPQARPVMVFPWLYFLAYSIAHPLIFRWYLTPPLFLYFLSIFSGIDILTEKVFETIRSVKSSATNFPTYLAKFFFMFVLPTTLIAQAWTIHPDHGINRLAPKMAWYKLELLYHQAADIINQGSVGQTKFVIAAGDVGVLGYYTQARILDTVGLNSAQTRQYYPLDEKYYVINYAIPAKLILDLKPEFVTFLEVYGRKSLLQDPEFLSNYTLIAKLDTDIYGSRGMLIYRLSK